MCLDPYSTQSQCWAGAVPAGVQQGIEAQEQSAEFKGPMWVLKEGQAEMLYCDLNGWKRKKLLSGNGAAQLTLVLFKIMWDLVPM